MTNVAAPEGQVLRRTAELFHQHRHEIFRQTDRLFAVLLAVQWVAGVAAAYWISPRAWSGSVSATHIHLWAAVVLGGVICAPPIALALWRPGATSTRYVIAVGQMLFSSLLIHLSRGRIETHFHIFGSLAFLAFYRDWPVLIPATIVVAADHAIRGLFWPESIFGVLTPSPWRWLEHTGWVVFEDVFLITACIRSTREMWKIAERQAELEATNALVESRVQERTAELAASEERFRSLSAGSPLGIFQADAAGEITYVNERWRAITGVSAETGLWEARARQCT